LPVEAADFAAASPDQGRDAVCFGAATAALLQVVSIAGARRDRRR